MRKVQNVTNNAFSSVLSIVNVSVPSYYLAKNVISRRSDLVAISQPK